MSTNPIDSIRASIAYTRSVYGVSEEALAFQRKRAGPTTVEPGPEDWALYNEARELLERVRANRFIGLYDEELIEPESYRVAGEYVETEDEWLSRIAELADAHGVPSDISRALSLAEFQAINAHLRPRGDR